MVFKGSLYILNLLCGIIPCEHKYQYPDTTPIDSQPFDEQVGVNYQSDLLTLNDTSTDAKDNLYRNNDYNQTDPLVVYTTTGKVRGYWMRVVGGRKIRAFEGIPFAEAPTGIRRFMAPLPVKPWTGLLHANLKGPKCLQYNDITLLRVIGSENCLFLNIYSRMPALKKNSTKRHPVIIYIHGGGFLTGSGNDFGASYLLQRNVVLVTVNYRLGVLGFMSTNDEESPGNAGLKDQAEAINWVYNNIESFNGDKEKIILLGHGSGGASVQMMMMSFRARGKFIAGISISGTAFNQWALHTQDQALNLTKTFAKAVLCPVHGSTKNMVACLRNQRGFDLVKMQISFLDKWPLTLSLFRPVVEDEYQKEEPFLTETPEEAYQKGTVDKIPWICGQAEDEGYTFLLSHVSLGTFGNLRKQWNSLAPDFFNYNDLPIDQEEITRRVNWLYFRHANPSAAPIKIYSDALGSRLIYTGIHKAIQAHSQHAETYAFMFGYNGKYNLGTTAGIKPSEWAVGHGEILGYILNSTNMYAGFQKNDTELVLSKILVNLIYNFADTQVPAFTTKEGENFHVWNPVTDQRNISFLHIDKSIKMISEPYLEQILYWESLGIPDSLPLANFSNEIQNVTSDPEAKGFVSTDITVLGDKVPRDLLPPIGLTAGTFANDKLTPDVSEKYRTLTTSSPLSVTGTVTGFGNEFSRELLPPSDMTPGTFENENNYRLQSGKKYPSLTTSSPISVTRAIGLIESTSNALAPLAPTTSVTTTENYYSRWLGQDFVPMPVSTTPITRNQMKVTAVPPSTTTGSFNANIFHNLIDSSHYDISGKNSPFGISVPILPTSKSNAGFITKSNNVGPPYHLNSLGAAKTFLHKRITSNPSSNENETMMTVSNTQSQSYQKPLYSIIT